MDKPDWMRLARSAYSSSTMYFDSSIRKQVENGIKQAQGIHQTGSKYYSPRYKLRNKFYRPKTRALIRKNEAIAAEAFFSNIDIVDVGAEDDSNQAQLANAALQKHVLQYRLTKSIPWFKIAIGGYQDAMTTGTVIGHIYWKFDKGKNIDTPVIKLIPAENFRFDPSADWINPIETSPYIIHIIPMYVKDIRERMNIVDKKTQMPRWNKMDEEKLENAVTTTNDSIRLLRERGRSDNHASSNSAGITDYDIIWVYDYIMEWGGIDYVFQTLAGIDLLSEPKPLSNSIWHGKRPYVVGQCVIETHKNYPIGITGLTEQTQQILNTTTNQRLDNVEKVLNKRWMVNRNGQVDTEALRMGQETILLNKMDDVKEISFSDITASSYQEQDRLSLDFDEIGGNFSANSVQSNRRLNETVGGMNILVGEGNLISNYTLRTYAETFIKPLLRLLVLFEQHYENDTILLTLAAQKAKLWEKFGISEINDNLLLQELTMTVNVGLGPTNPQERINAFATGMNIVKNIISDGQLEQHGLKVDEVINEVFGRLGYEDGGRFFETKQDQRIEGLQSQIQQLQQQLAMKNPPELLQKQLAEIDAKITLLKSQAVKTGVDSTFAAMQAGEVLAAVPQVADPADAILLAAGYQNPPALSPPGGVEFTPPVGPPARPATMPQTQTQPSFPDTGQVPASPFEGEGRGIEPLRSDSLPQPQPQPQGLNNE